MIDDVLIVPYVFADPTTDDGRLRRSLVRGPDVGGNNAGGRAHFGSAFACLGSDRCTGKGSIGVNDVLDDVRCALRSKLKASYLGEHKNIKINPTLGSFYLCKHGGRWYLFGRSIAGCNRRLLQPDLLDPLYLCLSHHFLVGLLLHPATLHGVPPRP